jgi:hypothetical protein
MSYTGTRGVFISLLSVFLLNACDTEGLGTDSTSTQLTSGSSSSKSCNLTEIITSADRKAASGDGQCSPQIANADASFALAVSLCESGKDYTATYNQYKQIADYAKKSNASMGCGSSTAPTVETPQTVSPSKYNVCVGYTNGGKTANAHCYGPVAAYDSDCGGELSYLGQYSSESSCITSRDNWVKNAFNESSPGSGSVTAR